MPKSALSLHKTARGKLEITTRVDLTEETLPLFYTPGVAEPCLEIARDPDLCDVYTRRWNTVAIVTDGTAVLGLGDIGPAAGLPVMEGKAILFKRFAGVDAFPILVDSTDVDVLVETVAHIAATFGGINLEDIAAPRCFEIEKKLQDRLSIPVFHDDQHGTAIVAAAALQNALRLTNRDPQTARVVINGSGAAGIAISRLLLSMDIKNIWMCDLEGILTPVNATNDAKRAIAEITNPDRRAGGLEDALRGADVFIGVSRPGALPPAYIRGMAPDSILFALSNPRPEIMPDEAKAEGVRIMGTGRSDFPNQINNVLAFPGLFRGALDARATRVTEGMKRAATEALAELARADGLTETHLLPNALDERVAPAVALAVSLAARREGVTRPPLPV